MYKRVSLLYKQYIGSSVGSGYSIFLFFLILLFGNGRTCLTKSKRCYGVTMPNQNLLYCSCSFLVLLFGSGHTRLTKSKRQGPAVPWRGFSFPPLDKLCRCLGPSSANILRRTLRICCCKRLFRSSYLMMYTCLFEASPGRIRNWKCIK